ncbi:MAG: hypothetical protein V1843_04620, partial [bacterium]
MILPTLILSALIICSLSCDTLTIKEGFEPIISSISASPEKVLPGGATSIKVTASDPEGGALTYNWSSAKGSLSSTSGSEISWTAPSDTGVYTVSVNVSDGTYDVVTYVDVFVTTGGDTTPPAPPTGLRAIKGYTAISLSWNANIESDLVGYNVYRYIPSSTTPVTYTKINISIVKTASYLDLMDAANMVEGMSYVVTAIDTSGNESAYSTAATPTESGGGADTVPPEVPFGLTATAGDNWVRLDWIVGSDVDLAGYKIYRKSSANSTYARIALAGVTAFYLDTTVINGITYTYKISAIDFSGNESAYSAEISVTPSGGAVAPPSAYSFILKWGGQGTGGYGEFIQPTGCALGPDNNIYVADRSSNLIQKFDLNGTHISQWAMGLDNPIDVAVSNYGVAVANAGNYIIRVFSHDGSTILADFGGYGSTTPGKFLSPHGIAFDNSNNIYVSDIGRNDVQKFTSAGAPMDVFTVGGILNAPKAVAVDASG